MKMPSFGKASRERLDTCDPGLCLLFNKVVQSYDCSILIGHRSKEDQQAAYAAGRSKLKWPDSKHNSLPSKAVDVAPYPINWGSTGSEEQKRKAIARFYHFAGYVKATAESLGIKIRWGGDWDNDLDFSDQNFDDLPHWEIIEDDS